MSGQAVDAAPFEQIVPAADRVVVEEENLGHFLTAHPAIQECQGVGAPRHATRRRTVASQRDQRLAILVTEKAATNHPAIRIRLPAKRKRFFPPLQGVGVYVSLAAETLR